MFGRPVPQSRRDKAATCGSQRDPDGSQDHSQGNPDTRKVRADRTRPQERHSDYRSFFTTGITTGRAETMGLTCCYVRAASAAYACGSARYAKGHAQRRTAAVGEKCVGIVRLAHLSTVRSWDGRRGMRGQCLDHASGMIEVGKKCVDSGLCPTWSARYAWTAETMVPICTSTPARYCPFSPIRESAGYAEDRRSDPSRAAGRRVMRG